LQEKRVRKKFCCFSVKDAENARLKFAREKLMWNNGWKVKDFNSFTETYVVLWKKANKLNDKCLEM